MMISEIEVDYSQIWMIASLQLVYICHFLVMKLTNNDLSYLLGRAIRIMDIDIVVIVMEVGIARERMTWSQLMNVEKVFVTNLNSYCIHHSLEGGGGRNILHSILCT